MCVLIFLKGRLSIRESVYYAINFLLCYWCLSLRLSLVDIYSRANPTYYANALALPEAERLCSYTACWTSLPCNLA